MRPVNSPVDTIRPGDDCPTPPLHVLRDRNPSDANAPARRPAGGRGTGGNASSASAKGRAAACPAGTWQDRHTLALPSTRLSFPPAELCATWQVMHWMFCAGRGADRGPARRCRRAIQPRRGLPPPCPAPSRQCAGHDVAMLCLITEPPCSIAVCPAVPAAIAACLTGDDGTRLLRRQAARFAQLARLFHHASDELPVVAPGTATRRSGTGAMLADKRTACGVHHSARGSAGAAVGAVGHTVGVGIQVSGSCQRQFCLADGLQQADAAGHRDVAGVAGAQRCQQSTGRDPEQQRRLCVGMAVRDAAASGARPLTRSDAESTSTSR